MGLNSSKNNKIHNINIINLLLYKDLTDFTFEKYIDIFLFLVNDKPLTEKTFKYYLKKISPLKVELYTQNNNESPVKKSNHCLKNLFVFLNINLNEKIDYLKFIKLINKTKSRNRDYQILTEIGENDVNILKKELNNIKNLNISDRNKSIAYTLIDMKIEILTYIEGLDKLKMFFYKMSKSIYIIPEASAPEETIFVIPEAVEIINSKIVISHEENIFIIPEAVKVFNH